MRVLLGCSSAVRSTLARAPELTTPASSMAGVRDGAALVRMGASPYASDLFHQPPLVLAALWPFFDVSRDGLWLGGLPLRILYILADVLTALAVRGVAQYKIREVTRAAVELSTPDSSRRTATSAPDTLRQKSTRHLTEHFLLDVFRNTDIIPDLCAAAYLVLPFSMLTCVALDTSVLVRTATASSLFFASKSKMVAAAFCIALAGYVEMRPLIYLVGAAAIDACNVGREGVAAMNNTGAEVRLRGVGDAQKHKKRKRSEHAGQDQGKGKGQAGIDALTTTSILTPPNSVFGRSLARYASAVMVWSAVLQLLSYTLFSSSASSSLSSSASQLELNHPQQHHYQRGIPDADFARPSPFEYFWESYVWQLKVSDHKPNVGLFWYFFSMVFDRFRPYFLFAFNIQILVYVIPLALRTWRRPLIMTTLLVAMIGMLRPYPTIGDMALPFAFALMHREVVARMRIKTILIVTMIVSMCLLPTMWFLWIFPGAGNANHYYFAGLTYSSSGLILVSEFIRGAVKRDRQDERREKEARYGHRGTVHAESCEKAYPGTVRVDTG
jgi:phosphatidylinositol glycan class U